MNMRQNPGDILGVMPFPAPPDRPLPSDAHNILEVFVYTNLNVIMSPTSTVAAAIPTANTATMTATATTTTPTTATTATATTATTPATSTIPTFSPGTTPQLLSILQTFVLDHFTNLRLPRDIDVITREFFANLPAVTPTVTPTTPITPTTPTVPITPITPTMPITSTPAT